ncbi:MAG: hypothetical protein ACREHF_02790 [Rhizomicrobium sp.]
MKETIATHPQISLRHRISDKIVHAEGSIDAGSVGGGAVYNLCNDIASKIAYTGRSNDIPHPVEITTRSVE